MENKEIAKNVNEQVNPGDMLQKIKDHLISLESELSADRKKLYDANIELHEARNIIENVLSLVPQIRREKARLDLKTALTKYKPRLAACGVNSSLVDFIVQKRVERILGKSFRISLGRVIDLEKKLGIFTTAVENKSDIFTKLRETLSKTEDMDEIYTIVRKMRVNLKTPSAMEKILQKEDTIRYFVEEADFYEKSSVMELLTHKTLSDAIKDDAITEKRLKHELKKLEGEFSKVSNYVIKSIKREDRIVKDALSKELPLPIRILSDYMITPVAISASALGALIIVFFIIGNYLFIPLHPAAPKLAHILESSGIPSICALSRPLYVFVIGLSLILIGGLIKRIDEKMREKIKNRYLQN